MREELRSSRTPLFFPLFSLLFSLFLLSPLPCQAEPWPFSVAIVTPDCDALVDDHPIIAGVGPPHTELRVVVQSSPGPIPGSEFSHDQPQDITTLTTTADAHGVFAVGPLTLPATSVSRYWEVVVDPAGGRTAVTQTFHQTAGGFGIYAPSLVSLKSELMETGTPLLFDIGFVGGTPPFAYTLTWPDERVETGTTSDPTIAIARRFAASLGHGTIRIDATDTTGRRAWWEITAYIGICIFSPGGRLESVEPSTFHPSSRPDLPATTISARIGGKFPVHLRLCVRGGGNRWVYTPDGGPCASYDAAWVEMNPGMLTFTWSGWDNTLEDNPARLPVPFPPSGHHSRTTLVFEWYDIIDGPEDVRRYERPIEILPWRP